VPSYAFRQVDVFPGGPLGGNPLAVVIGADDLSEQRMRDFARWTNLSETTFLLQPTDGRADYRVRIFTPAEELPFAGHPTLGSAAVWADATGSRSSTFVQECGVGLVTLRRTAAGLAFAAPPLIRSGAATDGERVAAAASLRLDPDDLGEAEWVDNGPGWLAVALADADAVLAVDPDFAAMPFPLGVVGRHEPGGPADFEVRAFVPGLGVPEDPVTGSLNAGIATWFLRDGIVPGGYTVRQGTAIGRDGLVSIERDDEGIWVGGAVAPVVEGTVTL
jgi:PhzF family phenazine biosynthesis protein